jgi:hypothetical protein
MMDRMAFGQTIVQAFQFPQLGKMFGVEKEEGDNKN